MLKEVIISLTENYHNIGHNGSSVDHMMDAASGMGHRIKEGHDFQGLIEAYHLEGIEGIGLWFDHMAKDFTSPAGIPLPFAEAIQETTGMGMDTAVDWLTINAADAIELGTQEAILKLAKNNKKAYKAILAVGTTIGFVDDNPILIAANTVHFLKHMQKNNKEIPFFIESCRFLNKTGSIISKVCIGVAATNIGVGLIGINLGEGIEHAGDILDLVEGAATIADILDGATTLGVGILASKGVKKVAQYMNSDKEYKVQKNSEKLSVYKSLKYQLTHGAPLGSITSLISYMQDKGLYPKQLGLEDNK